jgi:hypothetical protein
MSDLADSLGMTFATTADTGADAGFLSDVVKMFDAGDGAPMDTAAVPPPEPPPVDTAASPPPEQPAAPVVQGGPSISASPDATGGAAPVVEGSTPLAGSGATATARDASSWYRNMSPGAQAILASGFAGGAAGLLNALAQKSIIDEKRREVNQTREDVQRKGQISAIPDGAIKPKGVIDGARGA